MPGAIGVNLRVTGHSSQGGRKYMEDFFSVAYQQSEDECDLEFAFFGIFDGHGGAEAAAYAKEHLMRQIVNQKQFWSENDDDVLRAIREGYIATHKAMWREQEKWPRTATGLPSTAGTTATVAFIRHGKMYIGHVGDSGIVLGYEDPQGSMDWKSRPLTQDHKPECDVERSRIMSCGGKVVAKSGVSRVVWKRPRLGHKGPIRRSTPIDEIPFLAVARSLGDLWSYNSQQNEFVVSPDPDVHVIPIDKTFRCLIFGTDGLWNVLSPSAAVDIVRNAEYVNDRNYYCSKELLNPSRSLVTRALEKWSSTRVRADNTSVVTILLDPPGGPKRKQFSHGNSFNNRQQVGTKQSQSTGQYEQDWHTMEEACLNNNSHSSNARNVEEELDLLNESLYNTTHQYNPMDMSSDFHLFSPTPSSSSTASSAFGSSSNYENYINLSHHHHHHPPMNNPHQHPQHFQRAPPPPGGFLQHQLQGSGHHMMSSYGMESHAGPSGSDFDHNACFPPEVHSHYYGGHQHHHHQPQHALPTFSNLIENTASSSSSSAYSLTRLEAGSSSSSMYANYQQLIETTTNYTPQIDLNTINTFHDYAGIPLTHHQHVDQGAEGQSGDQQKVDYAVDHDAFAWSQEWQAECAETSQLQQPQLPPESNESQRLELPSSSDSSSGEGGREVPVCQVVHRRAVVDSSAPLSPTIQINEISSSGVVPTPPPPPLGQMDGEEAPVEESSTKEEPEAVKQNHQPVLRKNSKPAQKENPLENLRSRLRCQVSSSSAAAMVEKENKATSTRCKRKRIDAAPATTLAMTVTTRSSAATGCMSTRKSTAAATLLRSTGNVRLNRSATKAAALRPVVSRRAAEAVISKCNPLAAAVEETRSLLTSSRKFNAQEEVLTIRRSLGMVGRRLSKRDKVRTTTSAWRGVAKSTVQTRNRVQKR